mgnify:CR=1 FL=1
MIRIKDVDYEQMLFERDALIQDLVDHIHAVESNRAPNLVLLLDRVIKERNELERSLILSQMALTAYAKKKRRKI